VTRSWVTKSRLVLGGPAGYLADIIFSFVVSRPLKSSLSDQTPLWATSRLVRLSVRALTNHQSNCANLSLMSVSKPPFK
jgi:hypothetical protein